MRTWKIVKETRHTDEEKVAIMNELKDSIKKEFSGDCIAIVNVDAEPIRAREIAKEEVGRSIDLLRYASKALYPLRDDMRVGLKGDYPKSRRQIYAISQNSFNPGQDNLGSPRRFRIDENALNRMEKIGVFIISDALAKNSVTKYEEVLIRGIHWFSVSLTQTETSNAFLFLIVALESLFSPYSGQSIAGTVSESVAFLISANLKGRKQLIEFIRKSYNKRSKVAHGGNKEVSESDYYTLLSLVGEVLLVCIQRNEDFINQKELMSWIEDMKLS
jgi:transcription elongation factor GreA-like protein